MHVYVYDLGRERKYKKKNILNLNMYLYNIQSENGSSSNVASHNFGRELFFSLDLHNE